MYRRAVVLNFLAHGPPSFKKYPMDQFVMPTPYINLLYSKGYNLQKLFIKDLLNSLWTTNNFLDYVENHCRRERETLNQGYSNGGPRSESGPLDGDWRTSSASQSFFLCIPKILRF